MRLNKIKIKYICMKNWDMIYITLEIQTSPVALRYLGVMIWENHIRELWEYFKLWKMTLNRAFMGWYWGCGKWPQIEHLWVDIEDAEKDPKSSVCTDVFSSRLRGFIWYKTPLWYYHFPFMCLSRLDRDPFFLCVCFQLSTQDTLVGQRYYDE